MEFRARFLPTLGLSALLLAIAALSGWTAWAGTANDLVQGVLFATAIGIAGLGLILLYRVLVRPVMVRVDACGVYMRRLNATFPWETIASINLAMVSNRPVIYLEPAEPGHPVWTNASVMMARALGERTGQPELVVDLEGMEPGPEAFVDAARNAAPDSIPVDI